MIIKINYFKHTSKYTSYIIISLSNLQLLKTSFQEKHEIILLKIYFYSLFISMSIFRKQSTKKIPLFKLKYFILLITRIIHKKHFLKTQINKISIIKRSFLTELFKNYTNHASIYFHNLISNSFDYLSF